MKRPGYSGRLHAKLALLLEPARAASRAVWAHPRFAELFPELLFTLHCATRASVPLMEATRERSVGARADPVARALGDYLARHSPEEREHDRWLLEDLEQLGVARAAVLGRIPPPTVAALVGSQYYWALHHHPVALLGYIAVLEGYPLAARELERVMGRTGLPRAAFRTLLEHSDLDRAHRAELNRVLDRLPLSDAQSQLIVVSGFATLHLFTRMLEELLEAYRPAPARAARAARPARRASARALRP
jgi:hypothetical protein